jgi:CDP-glycerol glycerophosphotransferase
MDGEMEPGPAQSRPRLSVVIPVYNVEDFLDECLRSVLTQGLTDIEVVLVDDGSTDASAAIAQRWAATDSRFLIFRQDNHGLGHARNTGVTHARGHYLCFLDSDDVVPRGAYEKMLRTLEETGSDFVTGNVHRFNSRRVWQAPIVREVCTETRLRTHVARDSELLRDHLAVNKMFRRDFWDSAGLAFPVNLLYEDVATLVRAHMLADAVDVLEDVVMLWRVREAGSASITDSKWSDPTQIRDRVHAVRLNQEFLAQHSEDLKRAYEAVALDRDIRYFLDLFADVDAGYRAETVRVVSAFLQNVSAQSLQQVRAINRIKYHLLAQGHLDALAEFIRTVRYDGPHDIPRVMDRGRVLLVPELESPSSPIPVEVRDVTAELQLRTRCTDIRILDGCIEIDGWAYIDGLPLESQDTGEIRLWLSSDENSIPLRVSRRLVPDATRKARQKRNSYHGSGFTASLPVRKLRRWKGWRRTWRTRGSWAIHVSVKVGDVRVSGLLKQPEYGRPQRPWYAPLDDDHALRISWARGLTMRVKLSRPRLDRADYKDGSLRLLFDTGGAVKESSAIVITDPKTAREHRFPVIASDERSQGIAVVPSPPEPPPGSSNRHQDDIESLLSAVDNRNENHEVLFRRSDRQKAVSVIADSRSHINLEGRPDYGWNITPDKHGILRMSEDASSPTVVEARWGRGARLDLRIHYPGDAQAAAFRAVGRTEDWSLPIVQDGSSYELRAPLSEMPMFHEHLPLRSGGWTLALRVGDRDHPIKVGHNLRSQLPMKTVHNGRQYELIDRHEYDCYVRIGSELTDEELGVFRQHKLRTVTYPSLKGPVSDVVLYEAYFGKQFSDSPRAIFEELVSRGAPYTHAVVVRDQQVTVPAPARRVALWSQEYYEMLARARYVVSNTHLPRWFERAPSQTILQTWHGIGTKKVGLDIDNIRFANRTYHEQVKREAPNWDYLISPNRFASPILRRAFDYSGPLLETGAPRNDIFYSPEVSALRAVIRSRIGIDEGRRVVLYAPTWRDNQYASGYYRLKLGLDLAEVARKLGEEHVVLFRKHSNVVDKLPANVQSAGVVDVSDYPDVQHLLLIADVLVTDYSTLMFDFANTRRPMLFYTYDLENYRDHLRGFYLDFEAEVPGPLIRDEATLIESLIDAESVRAGYEDRYRRFLDRFCPWDDGNAASRVVDVVFS